MDYQNGMKSIKRNGILFLFFDLAIIFVAVFKSKSLFISVSVIPGIIYILLVISVIYFGWTVYLKNKSGNQEQIKKIFRYSIIKLAWLLIAFVLVKANYLLYVDFMLIVLCFYALQGIVWLWKM